MNEPSASKTKEEKTEQEATTPPNAEQLGQDQPDTNNTSSNSDDGSASIRRITRWMLIITALFTLWYLVADRLTPSTSQARVRGYSIPISPQVSGLVKDVFVENDQLVEEGVPLFEIDPEPYQVAVEEAEAALEDAAQQIRGDEKGIIAAKAKVVEAEVHYETVLLDSKRAIAIKDSGAIAERDVDIALSRVEEAKAKVANAQAAFEEAKRRFGKSGIDNTKFKAALAQLEHAKLDLEYTVVKAPYFGVTSNLKLEAGQYASPGRNIMMTFISLENVWVEAYMRENNLGNIKSGNSAEIVLDSAPGKVFQAEVVSTSFGVKWNTDQQPGELTTVMATTGWLRDPQRFPVTLRFTDQEALGLRREGGQADVIIYTGDNWIMNSLAWIWIRIVSLLSFAY